ncbi:MAG: hypothetical protein HY784_04105 [Chloroflexi bacterium]|nr:hypothetical protein [Chloroflexota bacterium]
MDVASWKGMTADTRFVNALMRQAIQSVEAVMGEKGLTVVLREAGLERYVGNPPPNNLELGSTAREYGVLNQAIESFYGRAGRGMLRRIGRTSFQWAVREQAALLGLAGVALKFMPFKQKQKFILSNVAKALMDTNPEALVVVEEQDGRLTYTDYGCAICHLRHSDRPACHLYVGSLEEALRWATGKDIPVEETKCKALGDPYCQFSVGELAE